MNPPIIRLITTEQIDKIESLWNALKEHHQQRTLDFDEYYEYSTFSKRKAELLSKDSLGIFIAELDHKAVGFCVVSLSASLGEVDSLFVAPEHRGKQLGQLLMSAGMKWLNNQNPSNIRLSVGQGNEEVLAFYEKLGFKQKATVMEYFE